MRYLTLAEVLDIHRRVIEQSGGSLVLNGYELVADVDDAEKVILTLAAGDVTREELLEWVTSNVQRLPT